MAESSRFFTTNNVGDGPSAGYTSAQFQEFVRRSMITDPTTEGVLYGILNALAVSGTATPISVATGAAIVYGLYYQNDGALSITVPTPISNPRRDLVVLRANMSQTAYTASNSQLYNSVGQVGQTVRLDIIKGVEASSPVAPALTQNANQWEIPIAQLQTTTGGAIAVTDQRTYAKSPTSQPIPPGLITNVNRQGGDATQWHIQGSTNYAPTSARIQLGAGLINPGGSWQSVMISVTFPVAFSATPLCFVTLAMTGVNYYMGVSYSGTPTTLNVWVYKTGTDTFAVYFNWLAIGPP